MSTPSDTDAATPATQQRLLIATTNSHKIREFRDLLAGLPYELVTPGDIGLALEIEETGTTFAANATLKATAWADASGLLTLAEDSGLEIDALGGEPGVYSARWAGPDVSYEERFRILLARLASMPDAPRSARYRAVAVIARPAPVGVLGSFEGKVEGVIASTPLGSGGFGYDPIFYIPEQQRTVGQMSDAEKHRISHRARAVVLARALLQRLAEESLQGEAQKRQQG